MEESATLQSQENEASHELADTTEKEQHLTFLIAGEEYSLDILCVQEIRGWQPVTPVPSSPSHLKGVMNLRGTIIPVTDLREQFGIEQPEFNDLTVVIVLQVVVEESKERTLGIVVDAVSDVCDIAKEQISEVSELTQKAKASYIRGLADFQDRTVTVLDPMHLFKLEGIEEILS